jgi:hypothetical protein
MRSQWAVEAALEAAASAALEAAVQFLGVGL